MKKFAGKLCSLALGALFFMGVLSGCGAGQGQQTQLESAPQQEAQTDLVVKMLDIGQGDAILIKSGGKITLIDTGDVDERDQITALLKKEKVTAIDQMLITHPHADHLGGAYAVLKNFTVRQVYDNGQPAGTSTYKTYMKLLKSKKIPYQRLKDGDTLDFGNGAKFKVFSPTEKEIKTEKDLNSNSIVGKLIFGDFSMLFTGDCEADREKIILKKYGGELKSTLLKSPHHGSKTSSNRNYLKMVRPEAVLISVGAGNDYKHPHQTTLNKYKDLKIKIYRTDQDGSITVTSNGKTYAVAKEKS